MLNSKQPLTAANCPITDPYLNIMRKMTLGFKISKQHITAHQLLSVIKRIVYLGLPGSILLKWSCSVGNRTSVPPSLPLPLLSTFNRRNEKDRIVQTTNLCPDSLTYTKICFQASSSSAYISSSWFWPPSDSCQWWRFGRCQEDLTKGGQDRLTGQEHQITDPVEGRKKGEGREEGTRQGDRDGKRP